MATALQLRPALQLVFSYAREDEHLRDQLESHLSALVRARLIDCWHDRDIRAGASWREQIAQAIARADVILLLISPHFVASDYCFTVEMADALKRHATGTALVIPVLLRPVAAAPNQPWAELQSLPRDARPATLWSNLDDAFADVARGVLEALDSWSPSPSPASSRHRAHDEPLVAERVFDAAVPSHVQVGQSSEVVALIRRTDSGGLRAILAADEAFAARPEAVRSRELQLEFPRNGHGRPLPLRLTLVLESPDFEPQRQTKRIRLLPQGDSPLYVFLAVPRRSGLLALTLELLSGETTVLSHLLRSQADEAAPPAPRQYVLATLPLETTGTEERTLGIPAPSTPPAAHPSLPPQTAPPADTQQLPRPPLASPSWPTPATQQLPRVPRPPWSRPPAAPRRSGAVRTLGTLAAVVFVGFSAWLYLRAAAPPPLVVAVPASPAPILTPVVRPVPMPTPGPGGGTATAGAAAVLAEARRSFERRDYASVVALADRAEHPSPALDQLVGRSLFAMGEYDGAVARFERAAAAEPENPEHRVLLDAAQRKLTSPPPPRPPRPRPDPPRPRP